MAAFTSTQSGNWNDPNTWGGAAYPGQNQAGDTWTIANTHTVTMPAGLGTLPFTVAAGTIAQGGILSWEADFGANTFCTGAIACNGTFSTPDNANTKKCTIAGDVAFTVADNNAAHLNLQRVSELHFIPTSAPTSSGCKAGVFVNNNGKLTMAGTSSASKDAKITGISGKEAYVYIASNTTALDTGSINNATFDYAGRYNASFLGAVNLVNANAQRAGQFDIGNIDVTNPCTVAGAVSYGIYAQVVLFDSTTGTLTANTATSSGIGILLYQSIMEGGTYNGTGSSGVGVYIQQSKVEDGTFTGVATSNYGAYFNAAIMNAGTVSGTATTSHGVGMLGLSLRGGTVTGTSTSGRGFHSNYLLQSGGMLTGTSSTGTGGYIDKGTQLSGGSMNCVNTVGAGGIGLTSQPLSFLHTGGTLNVTGNTVGFNAIYHSGATFQKTGTKGFSLYGNGITFTSESSWQGVEPMIYKDHASNKTATIFFFCSPWNIADFTTTGTVDFSVTTTGAITVAPGGSVTFPAVQPWDVAGWTAITYSIGVGAGNSPVYEYRWSVDNGGSWSAWTTFTSGVNLTTISAGLNGNDLIQIRATNGAGAANLTLTNFTITFSYARETSPDFSEEAEGPLFWPTYAKSAAYITIWATMPDDATVVTVTLRDEAGDTVPVTSAVATQKAGTTQWCWSTSNIVTQPTTVTNYRIQFKDQNNNKVFRDLYLGGTEDDIVTTKYNTALIPALF